MTTATLALFGLTMEGIRLLVTLGLLAPLAAWFLGKHLRRFLPQEDAGEEGHGRDYYLGFVVGQHVKADDLDDLIKRLRQEDLPFQLVRDDGGEKVFTSRALQPSRRRRHDIEAGLLSGVLYATLKTRFDVEEEKCCDRGDGYCRFVAVKG